MSNKSRLLRRFMPYASARDGLSFHHVHHAIDGDPRGELANGALLPSTRWAELTLTVSLELSENLIDRVLHPDEQRAPPVALVLAVRNPAAYLDRSICLAHTDASTAKYEHRFSLARTDMRGDVTIVPFLVRTSHGTRRPGYAWRKGAWLATGDPWSFQVDEQRARIGNDIEVIRVRFTEVPEIPQVNRGNWFYLQLDRDPPRIYLNDDHAALMSILDDKSTRGRRAAVRDGLLELLDATVWPALVFHAARGRDEEGEVVYGWQENVLRQWVRRLDPDELDLESGVERLARRALDTPAELLLELNAALQRKDHVRRIERLIAEVLA